ncbi:MAG: cytochrome c biogenesis protein CcdA [Actinobacteria bacterium]|nr:cytochrome c biogenesis protein CcdA [Actinomycetota bacterium]
MLEIGLFSSFIAGLLAFISPCVLPLVPVYIGMMSSRAIYKNENIRLSERLYLFINSLFFVLGFSIVFIVLGSTATLIGQALKDYSSIISRIGGAILIIFGLHYTGLFRIKFLNFEKRFSMPGSIRSGFGGSFVFGIIFSFGWIPCVGIILSGILLLASKLDTLAGGILLLGVFSLGLGIPFILASIFIGFFSKFLKRLNRHLNLVAIISGVFIILLGIVFVTDSMIRVIGYLSRYIPLLDKINF